MNRRNFFRAFGVASAALLARRGGAAKPLSGPIYGLPGFEERRELRIWDGHYHGFYGPAADLIAQHEETMAYIRRMGIERVIAIDLGGHWRDPLVSRPAYDQRQREILEQNRDEISGIIRIDPSDPDASCEKMDRWIRNGPCIGIKYAHFNRDSITCSHLNSDPIIRFARELGAVVYICTWLVVGGAPRFPGGGSPAGQSLPRDVVLLARRFPDMPIICGHSGGDWELAVREVRTTPNVMFEFSGTDPHSGSIDYAVKELGADRIVWGGHGPQRSLSTELSKVLDADLSKADRMKVLGGNYRRIAASILRSKGIGVEV